LFQQGRPREIPKDEKAKAKEIWMGQERLLLLLEMQRYHCWIGGMETWKH